MLSHKGKGACDGSVAKPIGMKGEGVVCVLLAHMTSYNGAFREDFKDFGAGADKGAAGMRQRPLSICQTRANVIATERGMTSDSRSIKNRFPYFRTYSPGRLHTYSVTLYGFQYRTQF